MAYASAEGGGYGVDASVIHFDPAHADHIRVPDAELLFRGEYQRLGPDLVVTGPDGRHHIIPGYFSSEKHPTLVAPNGASLAPEVIDLLAGSPTPGQYAQAQPTTPPDAIGKVEKVIGGVTVVRNGVAVALHVGDAVYKSDVVQTGANSSVGIGFPDGTALNLVANTRMALNDYSFDASGTSNSALFTLVEGTFAFVAGKVAHDGDMKIATPVATMGIRGTTGVVEQLTVTAVLGQISYSFAIFNDVNSNTHGAYTLLELGITVSEPGYMTLVTPQGPGQPPLVTTQPMTAAQVQFEQALVNQAFQTLNQLNNPNTSNPGGGGSSTPPELLHELPQLLQNNNGTTITVNLPVTSPLGTIFEHGTVTLTFNSPPNPFLPLNTTVTTGSPTPPPSNVFVWTGNSGGNWSTGSDWSPGTVPGQPNTAEILSPVTVTIDSAETVNNLLMVAGGTLEILSGGSLAVLAGLDNSGLILVGSTTGGPTLEVIGAVTLRSGGEIEASGGNATVDFQNSQIGNAGKLLAANGGTLSVEFATVSNVAGGNIQALGGTVKIDHTSIDNTDGGANDGALFADGNGSLMVFTDGTTVVGGTLSATGGGLIEIANGTNETNSNVTFDGSHTSGQAILAVTIAAGSEVQIDAGTSLTLLGTIHNEGTINVDAVVSGAALVVEGTVTLDGNGTVTLVGSADEIIGASGGGTLHNVNNTILGVGQIIGTAIAPLTLVNETSGVIDANGPSALTIDTNSPESGNTIPTNAAINAGTIEATGTGGLFIANTTIVNSSIDSLSNISDGTVKVAEGSFIYLENATILQGFVSIAAGGEMVTIGGTNNTIDTANGPTHNTTLPTITNAGTIVVSDNSSLTLASPYSIENTGTIELKSTGDKTFLYFNQPFPILSGGGNIILDAQAGSQDIIAGVAGQNFTTVHLDNQNNTISGAGAIGQGDGALMLQNDAAGIVDADIAGQTLTIDTGSLVTNLGVVEATNGAALIIDDSVLNSGTVLATGNSTLTLNGEGGNETVTNYVVEGCVTVSGTVQVDSGSTFNVENASILGGDIVVNGLFDATGTLSNDASFLTGTAISIGATGTLEATIGTLTIDPGTITNQGTLEANGGKLEIDATPVTNTGTLLATGNSTLTLNGESGTETVTNYGVEGCVTVNGTVQVDPGSTFNVENATILGGNIVVNGLFDATGTTSDDASFLTGAAISIGATGTLEATIGTLTIDPGSITNQGTLEANGGKLEIDATPVTNTGTLLATGNSTLTLNGEGGNETVTNYAVEGNSTVNGTVQVDPGSTFNVENATILGGNIIVNGLFDATGTTSEDASFLTGAAISIGATGTLEATVGTLTIDPGSITNQGTLEANGGTLEIDATPVTNTGTLLATNDSTLTLNGESGTETVTNSAVEGCVTVNGTVQVDAGSTFNVENVSILGGDIVVNGLFDVTGTTSEDASFLTGAAISIGATGTLEATVGTLTIDPGSITNQGTLEANGGKLEIDATPVTNTGTLLATGNSTLTLNGEGGNETVTNYAVEGCVTVNGTVQVDAGSTLNLENASIVGGDIVVNGILDATGTLSNDASFLTGAVISIGASGILEVTTGTLTIDPGTITNQGTLEANGGTLEIDDTLYNYATLEANGGLLQVAGNVSGGGNVVITGGGTANFEDAFDQGVTFTGAGTLELAQSQNYHNSITGYGAGDALNLTDFQYNVDNPGCMSVSWSQGDGSGTLTISNGTQPPETINLVGTYTQSEFSLAPDSGTGTEVVFTPTTNLVANGGFQTGDFTGWITGGNQGFTGVESGIGPTGGFAAFIGPIGSDFQLEQNIQTVAGDTYQISFELSNLGGTPNDFSVMFGDAKLMSLLNTPGEPYTVYTFDVVATSSSTALEFLARQDPSYWDLANVSVVEIAPVGTSVSWINASGGVWGDSFDGANPAADWSTSAIPTSGDDVTIAAASNTPYSVTINTGVTAYANSLTVNNPEATVVDQGTLALRDGLSIVAGTFDLAGGTIIAGGVMQVDAGSTIDLETATITGGNISVAGVFDATGTSYLTDAVISIASTGTLEATTGTLTIDPGSVDNAGTLEANGGTLEIDATPVSNTGTLLATNDSTLTLNGESGAETVTNYALEGCVTVNGTVQVDAGSTFNVENVSILGGDIVVNGLFDATGTLSNDASFLTGAAISIGATGTLEVTTGTLTIDPGTITNQGTLEANGGTLEIDATPVTNSGMLLATGNSTLTLNGASGTETVTNYAVEGCVTVNGTVRVDAGSKLNVENASIVGGDISVAAYGTVTLDHASIDGSTIDLGAGAGTGQSFTAISVPDLNAIGPSMSANGEFVAFIASTGLPGAGNTVGTIELYDTANGQLTDISAKAPPLPAGDTSLGFSNVPSINADGRYVVFDEKYQIANDQGPPIQTSEVLLYDSQSQTVTVVQTFAGHGEISGNGQYIAMQEDSIPGNNNSNGESVLVTDRSGYVLTDITGDPNFVPQANSNNSNGAGSVKDPAISGDGRFVTFWTTASQIEVNGTLIQTNNSTGNAEVYVYDRQDNKLQMVSVNDGGHPGNGDSGVLSLSNQNNDSWPSSLSADGRYVVFQSTASDLVAGAGDQNGVSNIFVYDTQTNTTQLVSIGLDGVAANGASYRPQISADGNNVTFASTATNLVAGDTSTEAQTYIYNTQTGAIELVSATAIGTPANNESDLGSALSANGSAVAFGSLADNLVPNGSGGNANIFLGVPGTTGAASGNSAIDVTGDSTIDNNATVNGGKVMVESGATLTLEDVTLTGTFVQVRAGANLDLLATIHNNATLETDGGTIFASSNTTIDGTGGAIITSGGLAHFADVFDQNVTFEGPGTLQLDRSLIYDANNALTGFYTGTVSGFGPGGTIDLTALSYSSTETDVWNGVTHTLIISNGTQTELLSLAGSYSQNDFALAKDASGGTEVVFSPTQVTLSGLGTDGNAVEGQPVTVTLGQDLSNVAYTWLVAGVVQEDGTNSFTPSSDQQGQSLQVLVNYSGTEHGTALAGTIEPMLTGNGLAGEIINPFSSPNGSVGDANGQTINANFVATDINYNLIPNVGGSDTGTTNVGQFLDFNGQTDGNTVSDSTVAGASVANTYLKMDGYIALTGGVTYTFLLSSDDGSTLSINGVDLINNDGTHPAPSTSGPPLTATFTPETTGFYQIDMQYFENSFGGASLLAQYSTDGVNFTDLTNAVLFQHPLTAATGGIVTMNVTDQVTDSNVTITGLPGDLNSFSGGTYTVNDGSGTWTGSAADFNTLSFTAGAAGTYDLSITAAAGDASTTQTYALTIEPQPPVITAPATATVGITQATAISGVSLSETGNANGETFTVTLSDTYGDLSATATGGGDTVSGSGTAQLTITGSLSEVNSDLATLTLFDHIAGPDTITLNATDSFGKIAAQQAIAVTASDATFSPTDGSAIKTALTLSAGDVVTFNVDFIAHDYVPFNDFSFVTVNGSASLLSDVQIVGDYGTTGWRTFTYTAPSEGTYTFGIGEFNGVDQQLNSHLLVDNLRVNGTVVQSFESGTFSGWSTSDNTGPSIVAAHDGINPTDGSYMALLDSQPSSESAIESFLGLSSGALADFTSVATSTPVSQVDPMVVPGTSNVIGNIALADPNAADTFSANFAPEGSNYLGTFSLDPVTKSNGTVSLGFEFNLGSDQINLASGQTLTQSYGITLTDTQNPAMNVNQTVSVSIGGPGNDNFVFKPGIGADTIVNFDAQHDTIQLDNFANAQTVQQLESLITADAHGDAVIALGHNDSITIAGVTAAELQQLAQAGHVIAH